MSIFQKSIVDKYLETLDVDVIDTAFESYKRLYSAEKIQRIKKLKEEQYQGGFLKDIFGSVLGYTIDPEVGYNLELEKKNETNAKKADGAILKDEKVLGVIELKSNTTKNLESIKDQAFGYKNNHKGCKYVISSNFHKLRFYVDDATEYEEFDLYNLDKETFKKFYLFLRKEGLLDKNIPKLLKEETKFHEENISKQLYKDYSNFKNKFFENIVRNNPQHDKLLLFKKSQKFLDRILFVLFAEDKELIPTNAISRIVESWVLADDLHYKPLYELFTILFEHLNVGHTYKSGYEIPAYNGGLFAPDEVLDNLKVDDEILKDDLLIISKYDFNTDVDVNILGHIFEHSLSEIEEIEAQLKGEEVDKSEGKRKKDGVFYTPKYITKYIVDNTVGTLCSEKKGALGLSIDFDIHDYQKSDGSVNQKGKTLFYTLESYKEWLLTLKILDPACGSGAFLNQALSFLIEEHKNIDDLIAELTNTPLRIFDTDKAILENNIFGVDINDESVEIAKLSLWLRTAQKGRKLSNLNNNIKCGNSLIDNPAVAGDKAFKWEDEFPEIFAKGGFDVVIGNPPYIKEYTNRKAFDGLHDNPCYQGKMDLWYFFGDLALDLIKKDYGLIGYIAPNNWITNSGASKFRNIVLNKGKITEFINFGDFKVFDSAGIQTMIYIMQRSDDNANYNFNFSTVINSRIKHEDAQLFLARVSDEKYEYFKANIHQKENIDKPINFVNAELTIIINKIRAKQNFYFDEKEIAQGIVAPQDFLNKKNQAILGEDFEVGDGVFNVSQTEYETLNLTAKEKKLVKPFYTTRELHRFYGTSRNRLWVIYTGSSFKNFKEIESYPNLKVHFDKFQEIITSSNKPYGLHRAREEKFFNGEKILSLRKCTRPTFTFTDFDCYVSQTYFSIQTERCNQLYLTGLLNSDLLAFWLKYQGKMQGDLYQVDKGPLMNLPIVNPLKEIQEKVAYLVSSIITNTKKSSDYQELLDKAKTDNNFDREIQLTKELEQLTAELGKAESEINTIVFEVYQIQPTEIATIEKNVLRHS
jgi:type I restriction-modification system DNA methylase subunit